MRTARPEVRMYSWKGQGKRYRKGTVYRVKGEGGQRGRERERRRGTE